jgi:hypothetical protein
MLVAHADPSASFIKSSKKLFLGCSIYTSGEFHQSKLYFIPRVRVRSNAGTRKSIAGRETSQACARFVPITRAEVTSPLAIREEQSRVQSLGGAEFEQDI